MTSSFKGTPINEVLALDFAGAASSPSSASGVHRRNRAGRRTQ